MKNKCIFEGGIWGADTEIQNSENFSNKIRRQCVDYCILDSNNHKAQFSPLPILLRYQKLELV